MPPGRARRTQPQTGAKRKRGPAGAAPKKDKEPKGNEPLAAYRAKRDFTTSPEPAPKAEADGGANRFVIHEHHARRLHWDLRLERDGVLACWALPKGLPEAPKDNRFAAATEEHPLEYLDFEGEIPRGQYGAGKIAVWDRGIYECLKWEPRKVEVALHGRRVQGRYALFPIEQGQAPKDWLIHRMDPPADPDREPLPQGIVPMLARAGELPVPEEGWAYEIKWDGVRAIAYSKPGELRLESRNLLEITDKYPELGQLSRALGSHSAVLDGEIVAFDDGGRPSFSALQQRMQLSSRAAARRKMKDTPVTYMLFDLLWLDGHSLMELPYAERRRRLAELGLGEGSLQTPEYLVGQGGALLEAATERGLEGVVAKRLDSNYQPGRRSGSWIKVKRPGRQEFVVGGWLAGKGSRSRRIGALLLGAGEPDGSLRYVGRVGSGFSERELDRLARLLEPLRREDSPFTGGGVPRGARFCEPRLVVEVSFSEWTGDGRLRHPVYLGLREDKPAGEVVMEGPPAGAGAAEPAAGGGSRSAEGHRRLVLGRTPAGNAMVSVEGHELKLSNLEKVLYPSASLNKLELIEHYYSLAPVLLAHLEGRPLTVTRWPDGVEGKSFFQKQAPAHRPAWVRTVKLGSERKPIDYVLAEDEATLVWLANLAAIELHTPLARAPQMGRPTCMAAPRAGGTPERRP